MQREIKFRGQRKDGGAWVFGDLITKPVHHDCVILENGVINNSVIPDSVGQYTGLKDRNGKEIYEGDLLAYPAANEWETENYAAFEVFYHDGDMAGSHIGFVMNRCHYKGSVCGTYIPSFKPSIVENMEVIGNIYENPELLLSK